MKKCIITVTATGLILLACSSNQPLSRVRISQPNMMKRTTAKDSISIPKNITWTDKQGKQHIVVQAEKDSLTGESITTVELSEITVTARSKQVAERNGKVNLDFIITVPRELINKKWQLQLSPVAYAGDTINLEKLFLSGADFAKMQKKGYAQYQAFIASIIPDSLYLQELFDEKGYRKAIEEIEQEYYQAWSGEFLLQDQWIDWKEKTNLRYAYFNHKLDRNKRKIEGIKTPLAALPAFWLRREMNNDYIPERYKVFADGRHQIKLKKITPEDSAKIAEKYFDIKRMAENQRKKEMQEDMYNKYVQFPYEAARLDTIIEDKSNFIYYYQQSLPATDLTRKIELTLNGDILFRNREKRQLPPSDTLTYFVSSITQFLDRSPRYKKKIISRKDEVNVTAYVNYKTGTPSFDENLGDNQSELEKINETIRNINYTGEFLIDSISMTATSSPEGSALMNQHLAKQRAINLKKYLLEKSDDREGVDSLFRPRWIGEDWSKLKGLIEKDDSLQHKYDLIGLFSAIRNLDLRENSMKKYKADYTRIREKHYPMLRAVEFKFYLHRRGMLQDTIVMPVIDSTYLDAIKTLENRQYKKALVILDNYYPNDYNTAICLMSLGYDKRALEIMLRQKETPDRDYILAILYARLSEKAKAVQYFVKSCDADETKIWRGKLDPEINELIEIYNLYKDEY